jgi:hypothetical protein
MKIRPEGAELFHAVGGTDKRQTKQLTQVTIFEPYFPSEGVLVVFVPVLPRSKFLKTFLYILQINDSVGV